MYVCVCVDIDENRIYISAQQFSGSWQPYKLPMNRIKKRYKMGKKARIPCKSKERRD